MTADRWQPWTADLPVATDPGGTAVVVSAHPDDEVLALGAWLSEQGGREVRFVVATDGESSHPDSPTTTPADLRRIRRRELVDALTLLGHGAADVTHLELRDSHLAEDGAALADALVEHLAGASLVLAPFERDGHPDHDAVGEVACAVTPADATLWRYPVWRWEWTTPEHDTTWLESATTLPSSSEARRRKSAALRLFRSQVEPLSDHPGDAAVVPEAVVRRAIDAPEVVIG